MTAKVVRSTGHMQPAFVYIVLYTTGDSWRIDDENEIFKKWNVDLWQMKKLQKSRESVLYK